MLPVRHQRDAHARRRRRSSTLNGNNIISVASALQSSSPSVIPMITIGGADAGTAPGAARPANVSNADGIVDLFNSAASRAGGLLSKSPATRQLYKAHYDAFAQLNRAANRSTTKTAYMTASNAAQFLGTNLAAKLQITPADLDSLRHRRHDPRERSRHRPRVHRRGQGVQDGSHQLRSRCRPCATIRTARSPTAAR